MNNTYKSKYHRQKPIRDFSEHQTMYDLVMNLSADDMDSLYALYFGKARTFSQLKRDLL